MKKWWIDLENKKIYFYCLLIGILTMYPLTKTGLIINDDLQTSILASSKSFPRFVLDFWQLNTTQGRTNFFGGIFYYIPFIFSNFFYFKFVQLGTILLDLFLLSYLLKLIFKSNKVFFITFLMSLLFLQNSWEHNPITSFPGQFSISCAFLLASFIFYVNYLNHDKSVFVILATFSYFITLFTYEVYAVYFPVFFLLHLFFKKKIVLRKIIPITITMGLYIVCYIIFRLLVGSSYEGAKIEGAFNIVNMFKVIWQYSVSSFPTYFFFNEKYQYLMYIYSDSNLNKNILTNLLNLRVEWIVKAFLVFFTSVSILKWPDNKLVENNSRKSLVIFIAISIIYIFVPASLLSLTSQYQESVTKYGSLGMPVSYFSYLSLIIALSIIIKTLLDNISNHIIKRVAIILISSCLVIGGLLIDFTNYYVSKYQSLAHYKWETVDRFLKTQEFLSLKDNSIIYSPTLFTQTGSLFIHDTYWTDYIRVKTGKNIMVENTEPSEMTSNMYYINYNQSTKEHDQSLVFYKIDSIREGRLLTNTLNIYSFSVYDEYYILGRVDPQSNDSNVVLNNHQVFKPERGGYQMKIDNTNFTYVNDLKKTVISGEALDANSVTIVNGTSNLDHVIK